MKLFRSRLFAACAASIATALVVGGIAYAQIPSANGVITGCYNKAGTLKIVDPSTTRCASGTTQLKWNQKGVAGAPGAQGANGQPGAQGPPGPQGPPVSPSTPLAAGQSESGTFQAAITPGFSLLLGASVTFTRPLPAPIAAANYIEVPNGAWPAGHCPAPGQADAGYFCAYEPTGYPFSVSAGTFRADSTELGAAAIYGNVLFWTPSSASQASGVIGTFTVTAP